MAEGSLPLLNSGFNLADWYIPKMLNRFNDAENLRALIDGISKSRDEILLAFKEINEGFGIADAVGIQLDIIGYKFGVFREGDTDNVFRGRILALGGLKLSGTNNQVIFILKLLGYGTLGEKRGDIIIHPMWDHDPALQTEPAAYVVVLEDPNNIGDVSQQTLEEISAAGVGVSQGWWMLEEGSTEDYILLEDAVETSPGVYEGTPILLR